MASLDLFPAFAFLALLPPLLMGLVALCALVSPAQSLRPWSWFLSASAVASLGALASLVAAAGPGGIEVPALGVASGVLASALALLVQFLGTVIGAYSRRYLQGETQPARYVAALAGVLAAVHLVLLADHWWVLIAAWAAAGWALQPLLCFYRDRPFAALAAHKKRLADRVADVLLIAAAGLAWHELGTGSLSALFTQVEQAGASPALQASAVLLALAVIVRTALLPVHGWLVQVMEAPTPVSALLHAGVVNLGGFVLIRFAPLLEAAPLARWLLVGFGLATAVLAGFAMLTRVSIKVRLAWSTVAQMGFMVLECGLGLYQLAALHLIGHSLYKAHTFLAASSVVQTTRAAMLQGSATVHPLSLWLAPVLAGATLAGVQALLSGAVDAWPLWWSAALALAWAPLFWWPVSQPGAAASPMPRLASAFVMAALLSLLALGGHAVPLGLHDAPHHSAGILALAGLAALYVALAVLQAAPARLETLRRWSYAGFYVDELYTRFTLRCWPTPWGRELQSARPQPTALKPANNPLAR
jgi:NAD(P)H-quinone oxidoreductase subunit 5